MLPAKHSHHRLLLTVAGLLLILLMPAGCSDDDPAAPAGGETGGTADDIQVDDGDMGVVVDTRSIFRKGYTPATATFSFADHGSHDATLDINATTNLAILSLDKDDLTEQEVAAFGAGVVINIEVRAADQTVLADHDEAELVLDDSNRPLLINTTLPYIAPPLALRQDLPYLIQLEGRGGIISGNYEVIQPDVNYAEGAMVQQYVFVPVAGQEDTYSLERPGEVGGNCWCWVNDGDTWMRYESRASSTAAELVLEQNEDGWVRMRESGGDRYLVYAESVPGAGNVLKLTDGAPGRFRLISDHIDWVIGDRGTVFEQPIMPPARLDFAYRGTLRNCSASTVEESIGRSEQRSTTITVGTTESLELFAGATLSTQLTVGYSVTGKVGVSIPGVGEAGAEVTQSAELQVGASVTTSATTASENTWSSSETTTTEVSRTRTITLPPYSAVEAYDAVKTIDDVKLPFTQVLRISATDKDTGQSLSGLEIRSQMLFNFVGGVVTAVAADYLDIGFRGEVVIDQMLHATTNVNELEGACD